MDQMGLKRSEVSFRRQGSSGLVWDDRFLSGELNKIVKQHEQEQEQDRDDKVDRDATRPPRITVTPALERSQSNGGGGGGGGGRGYRASTGRVSPAVEPPSPRVSACGFCSAFRKPPAHPKTRKHANKQGKRKTR
ncbi:uncharacterized protein J3R85_005676 [Psidium guajava]|nr:uncharacterized protein J3R85_005676 [Psidium guajava]